MKLMSDGLFCQGLAFQRAIAAELRDNIRAAYRAAD